VTKDVDCDAMPEQDIFLSSTVSRWTLRCAQPPIHGVLWQHCPFLNEDCYVTCGTARNLLQRLFQRR